MDNEDGGSSNEDEDNASYDDERVDDDDMNDHSRFSSSNEDDSNSNSDSHIKKDALGRLPAVELELSKEEIEAWRIFLQVAALTNDIDCVNVQELWNNDACFKHVTFRLQRALWIIESKLNILKNGVIYPQILDEIKLLENRGYTSKEANSCAWRMRSYLVRKILKVNEGALKDYYFKSDDDDDDENDD